MTEGPTEKPPHRNKPGLDLPAHKVQSLRRAFVLVMHRTPWLIAGVIVGALCVQTWPGQTKEAAIIELLKWTGLGLAVGVAVDFFLNRRR